MWILGNILLAMLSALGIALSVFEYLRRVKAKNSKFICLYFDEDMLENQNPDMVIICRTDADQEEIISRIGQQEERRIYLKYM